MAGQQRDLKQAASCGWTDDQLAEAFAYLG
jgi:hypothetical protein